MHETIDDFGYSDMINVIPTMRNEIVHAINSSNADINNLRLWSQHRDLKLPSAIIDSLGTKKIISLSAYIYEALNDGKILIVDEIDSSLHHIITRSILTLFNNELNREAQLFFTTHDLLLMDLKHLLRKDQILLTDIDKKTRNSVIISLASFTAEKDGFRGTEDVIDYYMKGAFGAIPTPDLFNLLLDIKNK